MANILILGASQPPFSAARDAVILNLCRQLSARGYNADVFEVPVTLSSRRDLLHGAAYWRSLDLSVVNGRSIDLVIATSFPSYYANHRKKSLWLLNQWRALGEFYGTPFSDFTDSPEDEAIRQAIHESEKLVIGECEYRAGVSESVVTRANKMLGVTIEKLSPPLPLGSRYRCEENEGYLLSIGHGSPEERLELIIQALPLVHESIKLKIVGEPRTQCYLDSLRRECEKYRALHRLEFLGHPSDEHLIQLYAKSLAVCHVPYAEGFSFVPQEALASGKPVVTLLDSGTALEFVAHGETGFVVEPSSNGISAALNALIENQQLAQRMGARGREVVRGRGAEESEWERIILALLSPLSGELRGDKAREGLGRSVVETKQQGG